MNRFYREHWIMIDDAEERGCRAGWATAVLLPVLEGFHAYADQAGEFGLREAGSFADGADFRLANRGPPSGFFLASQNGPGFTHAA